MAAALFGLAAVLLPLAWFVGGALLMMRWTGRDRFPQRRRFPQSQPPNLRWRGYDATALVEYWDWLGADGRAAERRFLLADMLFPAWYAAALLASLLASHQRLGPGMAVGWLVAPVAVAVVADWVENLLHLRLLGAHERGQRPGARWTRLASAATRAKLAAFWVATVAMVVLAGWAAAAPGRV